LRTAATTGSSSRERNLTRKAVVALQIALCVVLLSTAGLAVRTMINLENADLGLRAGGLLVFGLTMEQSNTPPGADERFFGDLLDRLRALPGVESVTASQIRLGTRTSNNTGVSIDRQAPPPGVEQPMRWNLVGPDYFATLGIPLRTGRDILASDTRAAPAVAVVNETFVKHYLPGRDPIGHLISFRGPSDSGSRIVAVAADSKYTGVREEAMPMAWFPYAQMTFSIDTMHFAVRTAAAPETIWPEINESVRRFAPNLPLIEPVTQTGQFAQTYASERLFGRLAILFGLVAVTLIATGVYGTLAFVVSRRTPEIGIRMALGARSGQVLRMVHGESLAVCAIGIFAGLPASLAVTRLFESRLYGVTPQDPLTFVAATGSILSVALVATLIPAQRAAKIDPATALRCQ
jgi:predicted permease